MKTNTRNLITATVIAAITLSMAGPAMAAGPIATVDRGECLLQIDSSLNELDTAAADLGASATVTDAHRAALEEILAYARNGLTAAQTIVSTTGSPYILNDVCRSFDTDYPVDGLIVPQVEITVVADQISASKSIVIDPDDTFLHAAEAASIAGADMTEAVALYGRAMVQFSEAFDLIDGVVDSALSITPSYFEIGLGSAFIATYNREATTALTHWTSGWSYYKAAYASYDEAMATL